MTGSRGVSEIRCYPCARLPKEDAMPPTPVPSVIGKRSSWSVRPHVTDPTTILLIDHDDKDRTYYAARLKISLPDSIVLEAKDSRSGLELYWSRRVDCIVTEIPLPDGSGFRLLTDLVPHASEPPPVAVIMLTRLSIHGLAQLAKTNGAQACFVKRFTTGDELADAIQAAIAKVGATQKDRRQERGRSARKS